MVLADAREPRNNTRNIRRCLVLCRPLKLKFKPYSVPKALKGTIASNTAATEANAKAAEAIHPKVADLLGANVALRRQLAHDVPIKVCSIPWHRMKLLVFSYSGVHNAGGGSARNA